MIRNNLVIGKHSEREKRWRLCLNLNVFVILIYPRDVNVGHLLDKFWDAWNDRQNFSCQFGSTNFTGAWWNHRDLLGLWQWCSNFGGNLWKIFFLMNFGTFDNFLWIYLWQCFEKHFNHCSFFIFLVGFSFLSHLFSFCLSLGVDCKSFSFTTNFDLKKLKIWLKTFLTFSLFSQVFRSTYSFTFSFSF